MSKLKNHGGPQLAAAVKHAYFEGQNDYNMKPLVRVDENQNAVGRIKEGDTVIFGCRRGEREVELTEMFTDPQFDQVERKYIDGLDFIILTLYHEKFKDLPVAFAPTSMEKPLAQVISEAGLRQLHCAESEKYAHVTFFFNGGISEPFAGEEDVCIPSPRGIPFEEKPELSLPGVVDAVTGRLGQFDFGVVNFANGDIIGHTSSNQAKIAAAECVSRELDRLVEAAKAEDYVIFVTADHGNLEIMTTAEGNPHVAHTTNLVPFIVIDPQKSPFMLKDGALCNVAPTVLEVMGLEKPDVMTASSLLTSHGFEKGRKVLLVILDGWGFGALDETNPIHAGHTAQWDALLKGYPNCSLRASGSHVGLGEGKAGNSEAGHLNLGAGRVVTQDDQRLENAIADGSFAKNPVFVKAIEDTQKRGAALHLLAFLTERSSHGSIEYSTALSELAKNIPEVYLHIIFDGRSTEPGSAPEMLLELEEKLCQIGAGQIVGGVGRGIVLERDRNYDKVKLGYDAMVLGTGTPY
ncbi:MAG: phosphoglycerate mutase (2,3-diphosphoglycerate-independent) [Clostridiales bacterium]|nr:phosphoglycerate mutase (2,3-diphosphoglycerate-independent) [Clostridiales bacterium]